MVSKLLVNYLLFEKYKEFPSETLIERELQIPERPEKIGPEQCSRFLLQQSQIMFALAPNVRLTNLEALSSLTVTCQVHAVAIREGLRNYDSILSVSRLFNILSDFFYFLQILIKMSFIHGFCFQK